MLPRSRTHLPLILLVLLLLICAGGGDDDPFEPTPGTIEISVTPTDLEVTWTLSGPEGYSLNGSNTDTIEDLIPGNYTLV